VEAGRRILRNAESVCAKNDNGAITLIVITRILAYVELIKFRYHITYLTVFFAAALFHGGVDWPLIRSLLGLYVCFNVLLYGGIYPLNDLRDVESDRAHPRKKNRPIASSRVSPGAALIFSAAMICAGLVSVWYFFGVSMFFVCLAILGCNLFYSFVGRNVPYLDIAANSITHPLRFLLGSLLVNRPASLLHLGAIFCFIFGLSCLRRDLEKDVKGWETRPTLKAYSQRTLRLLEVASMAGILLFLIADGLRSPGFYSALIPTYLVLVMGARVSAMIRAYMHHVWTR
jgi:decaprenyl-phosphate phosphoribosyltransferase